MQSDIYGYGYLQPIVNNDAEVHTLQSTSLNNSDVSTADSEFSNQIYQPLYTAPGDTPPSALYSAQNHENIPQLRAPHVDNQTTSNTTSVNLKLPVRLQSFKKLMLWLYCCQKYCYGHLVLAVLWQGYVQPTMCYYSRSFTQANVVVLNSKILN